MKRIILDHLRRWWPVWIAIGIFNFIIAFNSMALLDQGRSIDHIRSLNFPILLWLSAFTLNFDLQRGSGRVLTTLPVTARHIGRAWWIFSVALPALFLTATSGLAMLIHSAGTANGFPMNGLVVTAITYALFFGSLFYLLIGSPLGRPQNVVEWARVVFLLAFIIGIFFFKPTIETPQGVIFLLAEATLSVAGWFRAEQMVSERGGFRMGVLTGARKPGLHKAPEGFGGLPFLWQCLFIRLGYMGLAIVVWMLVMQVMMKGNVKLSSKQFFDATHPAFSGFGYFFIYLFLVLPTIMQLRLLRTLPISTSKLAATLVLMPAAPIFIIGLAWAAFSGSVPESGTGYFIPSSFLTCAALTAIGAPVFVWRGLKLETYLLLMFLAMASTLGPIFFYTANIPPTVAALVSLGVIALAFEITRRLLQSSSNPYRNHAAMMGAWGGGRR